MPDEKFSQKPATTVIDPALDKVWVLRASETVAANKVQGATVNTLLASHVAAADPHPAYLVAANIALTTANSAGTAATAATATANQAATAASAAQTTATNAVPLAQKGAVNGVAVLDASSRVPLAQVPVREVNRGVVTAKGTLACAGRKQQSMPANSWTVIDERIGGSGCIRKFWLAVYQLIGTNTNLTFNPESAMAMRITFDGAAVPQIGGTTGIPLGAMAAYGLRSPLFRVDRLGVFKNGNATKTSNWTTNDGSFGFFITHPMPFSNGYKIELFNPCPGSIAYWSMPEVILGDAALDDFANPAHRLFANAVDDVVADKAEYTILNTTTDTALLGWSAVFIGPTTNNFLEGKVRHYYNGSATADYVSSGTEDYFNGGFYWANEGRNYSNDFGLSLYGSSAGDPIPPTFAFGWWGMYRFFPRDIQPRGTAGLKLTWTNSDPLYGNTAATTNIIRTVWYYKAG